MQDAECKIINVLFTKNMYFKYLFEVNEQAERI